MVYALRRHITQHRSLARCGRLCQFYDRGIARLNGTWVGSGPDGSEFASAAHDYASDLNIIGDGSLFQFLCTCRTDIGNRSLALLLLKRATIEESIRRQEAIQELSRTTSLREAMVLLGDFTFQDSRWQVIADWLASPSLYATTWLRRVTLISSCSFALLLMLGASAFCGWGVLAPWLGILLLLHTGIGLWQRSKVVAALPAIRSLSFEIGVMSQGLSLLHAQKFQSPLLEQLSAAAGQDRAPRHLRQLERMSKALEERNKEWFYAISRTLLIGTQVFWSIEKWKAKWAAAALGWLDVWGQFEALSALGNYAYEHPENEFPSLLHTGMCFVAEDLRHPLLPRASCIGNGISLHEAQRFYVISGSNMSGKSTLLRAIGLNAVLAYAGAPVCARALSLSRFSICACMDARDSLLEGRSRFYDEMARLAQGLTLVRQNEPILFLIDEILSGTNSHDRRTATEAIIRDFVKGDTCGALSTHDLALTEIAMFPELHGSNMHMGSGDAADPFAFDYRLKPGITKESNALAIARLAGVNV